MDSIPSHSPPRLQRALGPLIATAIIVGNVIGSGVFKKPQLVADNVPNFGFVALVWPFCAFFASWQVIGHLHHRWTAARGVERLRRGETFSHAGAQSVMQP